jgi:DnaJ family protein A protein 5
MIPGLQILCLGLGKPFSDRSAQIQLALLLELSARLQSVISVQAYDPVSDDGDRKVLDQLGVSTMEENLVRVGIQGPVFG